MTACLAEAFYGPLPGSLLNCDAFRFCCGQWKNVLIAPQSAEVIDHPLPQYGGAGSFNSCAAKFVFASGDVCRVEKCKSG